MSQSGQYREAQEPIVFDALLTPHRSLSPRGFLIMMATVCVACLAAGALFVLVGAWPVGFFLALVVALTYVAFRVNYRHGRVYETLQLTPRDLTVRRVDHRGRASSWRFQSTWLQVLLEDPRAQHSRLTLRSHGRNVVIGAFLSPAERLDLAAALRLALARAKCAPQPLR